MTSLQIICYTIFCFAVVCNGYNEGPCSSFDHPDYGTSGQCIDYENCPGNKYMSNLCPTRGNRIKCCFTTDACKDVTIVSRSDWGARAPKSTSQLSVPVPYVFIHHTDGTECASQDSCSSIVRGIQNYHMDNPKRDYDDIGYSFLVGGDGKVYEGRGWDRVGAHTKYYNSRGIAISFIGNFSTRKPKQIALDAAKNLINCGVVLGKVSKTYTLKGHRDVGTTTCPGDALYAEIKTWPRY